MERCWALLLGVAVVAAVAPAGRAAPPALAYPQALAQAVDAFNRRPEARSAFRLLSAEPEPTPDVQLSSLRGLNLTLMETECEAGSRTPLEDCDFKENGAIKDCAGSVQLQEGSPELDLRCVDASAD
ncbi:CTHL2 protein, partial [Eudromia elegans]|nr:CTHL2 protein [Eudromia elegans]